MLVEKIYSVKEVGALPRLTGDLSPLHQEGPMLEHGRWPIVSGMQLLADSAKHAAGYLRYEGNLIRIVFGEAAHPNEPLRVGIAYHPQRLEKGVRLVAFRGGKDLLSREEEFSAIEWTDRNPFCSADTASMVSLPMELDNLDIFAKLVCGEDRVVGLLYAIARSSQAMCSRILAPKTASELALHEKIYSNGIGGAPGWLPAYTALTVFTPPEARLDGNKDLDFKVNMAFERKNVKSRIECSQAGHLLYAAVCTLRLRAFNMLLQIAKERHTSRPQ